MKVTTVHGIIGMDYVSGDHGCREYPVPLSYRDCSARVYDYEGEKQNTIFLARKSRPADYRDCTHPRFSCHGVVLWMVGRLYHAFAGGEIL